MRLLGLAVLGVAHTLFFFVADILLTYAMLGITLVFAWRWSDKALLKASQGAALLALIWMIFIAYFSLQPEFINVEVSDTFIRTDTLLKSGTFWQSVRARLEIWPLILWVLGSLNWGLVLACFFLGMWAGRNKLLGHPEQYPVVWAKCR
jgi:uncharacterized protein